MIRWIILSLPCLLCLWIGRNISFNEFIIKQAILINRLKNKSLLRIQILLNTKKVEILSKILIGLVALEHIYILWIEMFAWTTKGRTTFKSIPDELFGKTKGLAANQGLYNGFPYLVTADRESLLESEYRIVLSFLRRYCRNLWSDYCSKINIFQTSFAGSDCNCSLIIEMMKVHA